MEPNTGRALTKHETTVATPSEEGLQRLSSPVLAAVHYYANIRDDAHQKEAGIFVQSLTSLIKQVGALFDDPCSTAHALHKMLTGRRGSLLNPLKDAKDQVGRAVKSYERKVREEAERVQREEEATARAKAEAAQAEQVKALEAAGEPEAAKTVEQAVPTVNVAPVPIRAPVVGVTMRDTWKFEVTDPFKLPRSYLCPDMVKIGKYVRAHGNDQAWPPIPGVRTWVE